MRGSDCKRKVKLCLTPCLNKFTVAHMPKQKMMSNAELRDKIKAGNDFVVKSKSERKRALMVASVIGVEIITRENAGGGFRIFIPSDVPN